MGGALERCQPRDDSGILDERETTMKTRIAGKLSATPIVVALATLVSQAHGQSIIIPADDVVTVHITNNSGAAISVLGTGQKVLFGQGQVNGAYVHHYGYLDQQGNLWSGPDLSGDSSTYCWSIAKGEKGAFKVPKSAIGGRLYVSHMSTSALGSLFKINAAQTQVQQPPDAPATAADLCVFLEYSYAAKNTSTGVPLNNPALYMNTSFVDNFVAPVGLTQVRNSVPIKNFGLKGSRAQIIAQFKKELPAGDWQKCLLPNSSSPFMVQGPQHAANQNTGSFDGYFDSAIKGIFTNAALQKPGIKTPDGLFDMYLQDGNLVFDGSKKQKGTYTYTQAELLALTPFQIFGNTSIGTNPQLTNKNIFAALARGTATGNWFDKTSYYKNPPYNYYAKVLHEFAIAGHVYAFPFDDVGGQDSSIPDGLPTDTITATIGTF